MTYKIEQIPNPPKDPIIVATLKNPYDPRRDTQGVADELAKILGKAGGPVYYIADLSEINISFSELMLGLSEAFKTPGNAYANPKLKVYTVGSAELVRLGVEAASKQQQYGQAAVKLFTSVNDAVAQIHADIAQGA